MTRERRREPRRATLPEPLLLTSEDLFGDIVKDLEPPPVAAAATEPVPVAVHFGPYRLLRRVAVGGMAEVFKASRSGISGFEKIVAIKRLLPHLARQRDLVALFIDEAKIVAQLTHANITQILDLGKLDRSYYIAMEYVHGRDLRSTLQRAAERGRPLPLGIAVLVASRICSALGYAHHKKDARGRVMHIVHRDVSPQNILISFEGEVKLTDFGIAKVASRVRTTARHMLRGKLLYMCPEQARGETTDHRSDIYSLGLVCFEMLTGRKPFQGQSEAGILEQVCAGRVTPPSALGISLPPRIERVLMKALEADPDERYQDAVGMFRALERAVERPATEADLAALMEVLFDADERGNQYQEPAQLRRALPTPPQVAESDEAAGGYLVPRDAMSVEKLLRRFRRP